MSFLNLHFFTILFTVVALASIVDGDSSAAMGWFGCAFYHWQYVELKRQLIQ